MRCIAGLFSHRPDNLSEIMEQNIEDRDGLINPCYTAKRESGLASIIQSLPKQERLRDELPIAIANLFQAIKIINGKKGKNVGFVFLTATRDITTRRTTWMGLLALHRAEYQ